MATYVFDDHVDAIKPGDRVMVTGIFRALPVRVISRQRSLRSIFKTYVDVIHVAKDDPNDTASFTQSKRAAATPAAATAAAHAAADDNATDAPTPAVTTTLGGGGVGGVGGDGAGSELGARAAYTAAEEATFRALARGPDIYGRLVRSLAPSVWELDDVKRGILCQLFSGTCKVLQVSLSPP